MALALLVVIEEVINSFIMTSKLPAEISFIVLGTKRKSDTPLAGGFLVWSQKWRVGKIGTAYKQKKVTKNWYNFASYRECGFLIPFLTLSPFS